MKNTIKINTQVQAPEESNKLITSTETYKVLGSNLAAPLNEILQMYSQYAQSGLVSVAEVLRETIGSYLTAQASYLTREIIAEPLRESIIEFGNVLSECYGANLTNVAASMAETLSAVTKDIASEQIKQLQKIDLSAVFDTIILESCSLSEVVNAVYSMTQEYNGENTENDDFTEEEIQEVIKEQITNPIGVQERFANWTEKKKIKYFIVYMVLNFLYGIFCEPYLQEKVGMPVMAYIECNVKELPEKGAEIVGHIKENVKAIILEDTNYYYKVSFIDENGKTKEGYVAKRNLKLIEGETEEQSTDTIEENESN